jgi:hypothetical protein
MPVRGISKADVYYGLSKVDDISDARILLRKGFTQEAPNFVVKGTQESKLITKQKAVGPLTEVFKKETVKKSIPKLKTIEKTDDVVLAPLKTETKSKFWGTGQYERTDTQVMVAAKELQGFKDNVLIETYQPQSERMDEGLKVGVGVLEINKEEEREISKMAPIFKEVTQQKEIQNIRPIEKVRIEPIQKVFTQQAIQTRQPQVLVIPTPRPQKPKPKSPKPPKKITKIISSKFDDPLKRRKKPLPKKKRPEEFLAITKRYGKERVIARGSLFPGRKPFVGVS